MNVEEIVEGITRGNRRLLARAITYVENEHPISKEILRRIYSKTGKAHVVGITGFPGVGKSTIVSKLTEEFRKRNKSVGIVAVDPSSPFTGGALLGDRLRLDGADVNKNLWLDDRVFFRSMGSRGRLGGIAKKTGDVVKLLDSAG
ncbi:MAG: nucleoside-triphosphatase, partial [Candidatus Bathyarchaeia archaeon]